MDKTIVTYHEPTNQASEAYRVLRTNLRFSNIDTDHKVILFTSARANAGKSTTISNLAVTMAKYSLRTLLIDADLRKPMIHDYFKLKKSRGLTNYLIEKRPLDQYVKEIEGIENLHIMTSGIEPPEPSELLFSNKMKSLIEEARSIYDIILIDSPPILAASDASILSSLSEGVVLVIASHESKINDVQEAKMQIERTGKKILGAVLSKVKSSTFDDKYYY